MANPTSDSGAGGAGHAPAGVLSLARLRSAFARMLGAPAGAPAPLPEQQQGDPVWEDDAEADESGVSTRSIVEAMLFVGGPGGAPLRPEAIAAAMRDVTPAEVGRAVDELNSLYQRDAAPQRIELRQDGYCVRLIDGVASVVEGLAARPRTHRFSPALIETLAVVAYQQPVTLADIDRLRGRRSSSHAAELVRRDLCRRVPPPADTPAAEATYRTTERFLRAFSIDSLEQLPRGEELGD